MQLHRKPKKKPETMPVFTEQPPVYNMILECICAGLFSAGFCVSFLHYGTAEVPLFWVLLCAAAAVLCRSLSLWKPFRKTALLVPNGLALLVLLIGFSDCKNGAILFLNSVISRWNTVSHDAVSLLGGTGTAGVFSLIFTILLIAAWGYLLVQINKPTVSFFVLLVLTLPALLLQCFSGIGVGLYLIGWLLQRICHCERSFSWKKVGWFVTASAVILSAAAASGSREFHTVNVLRENVRAAITRVRYGEDTLPKGDLSKAYRMNRGDKDRLMVRQTQAKDLYLRGFVGADYDNGKWQELNRSDFRGENDGIESWFAEHQFSPSQQYCEYGTAGGEQFPKNRVSVENNGADRRYVYLPYSADQPDCSTRVHRDAAVQSAGLFGTKQYDFTEYANDYPGELLYVDDWAMHPETKAEKAYLECESIYRSFVYQNYLDIPENLRSVIQEKFHDPSYTETDNTVYQVTQHIHDVLENTSSYQMEPGRTDSEEPLEEFLNGGTGNSAFYATAAVLAYRSFGIPARYAEGYYVNGTLVRDKVSAQLTAKDAHAWAEVYMDGMGWIPIDATPGYYHDVYTLMQMVQQPQNVEKVKIADDSETQTGNVQNKSKRDTSGGSVLDTVENAAVLLLGIAALLLILAAVGAAVLEVRITVTQVRSQNRYRKADERKKQDILCMMIPKMLHCMGVEMHIGWQAETAEQRMKEKIPELRDGEYERVNQLMEKYIYGETALQPYEVRVLTSFLKKISDPKRKTLTRRERFQIRRAGILMTEENND